MKRFLAILVVACMLPMSAAHAHGPSGQKIIKEVIVKAAPAKAWKVMTDFASIGKWHPNVESVKLEERKDDQSDKVLLHRLVTFKNGKTILEKLREVDNDRMKMDYKMVDGAESTIAVSGYRTVLDVEPGEQPGTALIRLTARFYNKANALEAKEGEDNKAANKDINEIYDAAAEGLQAAF